MRFTPRPDQTEAVDSIVAQLENAERTQAIMACGTGKTFVSQKAAERITATDPDSLILVAVPNLVLVEQMIGEWSRQASPGHEFATLAVNSRRDGRAKAEDDEITDVAINGVTSDPAEIAAFMAAAGRKVIFSTYQSMAHISTALGLAAESCPGFELDLLVMDEAHRTAGVTRADSPTAFKLALDNAQVPAAKRLFMTATPRISKMRQTESAAVSASMDNPELFGHRAITRSLSWAVKEDLLAPYRTYVIQVDDAMLQASLEANPRLRVGGQAANAQHVAAAIALAKNARINGLGGIITYSSKIAGALEFGRVLQEVVATLPEDQKPAGRLTVSHINGGTPADERARILGTLDSSGRAAGDWSVVTNCNCLVEGVNVPSMDAIMFVDPRKSLVSIVQAIGRPMRKDRNNPEKIATILLPVFVGAHENVQAAIDGGAFEHVSQTITALRDVDDALSEKFVEHLVKRGSEEPAKERELKTALIAFADSDGELLPGQPEDSLIRVIGPDSSGLTAGSGGARDRIWADWHRGIETALVDEIADWWERGFAALQKFVEREGNAQVSKGHVENGLSLGNWLNSRRKDYRKGVLDQSKIHQLEALPGMAWNPSTEAFNDGLAALRKFVNREGHTLVTYNHSENGINLGSWVQHRRREYRKGVLDQSKIQQLEALPEMTWDPFADGFSDGLDALQRFVVREGHTRVPHSHSEDGFNLGIWLANRRSEYRKGILDLDRIRQLESFSEMTWDPVSDAFNGGLAVLRKFVDREGHARVPQRHVEDGFSLGTWMARRRDGYHKGILDPSAIRRLESLPGMTWDPIADAFNEGVGSIRRFADREGHVRVPQKHVEDGFNLGVWLSDRRKDYREGILDPSKILQLESFPSMSWDPKADASNDSFNDGLNALNKFVKREGHARVPAKHVENRVRVGIWLSRLRQDYHRGTLAESKVQLLEALPGMTWNPITDVFNDGVSALQRFVDREGNARVPFGHSEDGFNLGSWIANRRNEYRKGVLDLSRIRQLESFPRMTWDPIADSLRDGLSALKKFAVREGHARVPQKHAEGRFILGSWIGTRRKSLRKDTLPESQIAALDAISPTWRNGALAPWESAPGVRKDKAELEDAA